MLRNKAAFTVIELLCVLTVMGIVAAVAVPSMVNYREHYEKSVCFQRLQDAAADVRSGCVIKRMEKDDVENRIFGIVKQAAEQVSDGEEDISQEKSEDGFFIESEMVCPSGGKCRFSWKLTSEEDTPDRAEVEFSADCAEHDLHVSESFVVTYCPEDE